LGPPCGELRAAGAEMKTSCQLPAEAPLSADPQPAAAPTLVKYAEASPYPAQVARALTQAAAELLLPLGAPDRSITVDLAEPFADPLREMVATLLYSCDQAGHSYRQIQA